MAWIQPFLNWVAGMIPTKDDFNRIEGNTQYLKDEIDTQMADLATNKVDKVSGKGLSTNDYTTTEKNKLAGIEAGATADQTAAEILTLLKTVDTNTSGLNANYLQGKQASDFLTTASVAIKTGTISDGGVIPQTTGYSNYAYFVSLSSAVVSTNFGMYRIECSVNLSRQVTCKVYPQSSETATSATANYIEIAWK